MNHYRIILACLSDPGTAPSVLNLALALGRDHAAHVEALQVAIDAADALPFVGEGLSGTMGDELQGAIERHVAEKAGRIREQFVASSARFSAIPAGAPGARAGFSATLRQKVGREEESIVTAGRLSDLIVMAQPAADRDLPSVMSLNAALMETGRPVLLAPEAPPAALGRSVAVLWNGSLEASRAVMAALPFLTKAERVDILSAREKSAAVPAELAAYLAWHGVRAETHAVVATSGEAGEVLLSEAEGLGADMLVMGAYTHSRLRELILGGVTEHMLHAATLPVLLCH